MLNFSVYINRLLSEGGNVKIGNHSSVPIDLTKHNRNKMTGDVKDFLHSVHNHVHKNTGEHLFGHNKAALRSGTAYAGSTREFMNKNTSDDTFINKYGKKRVGDIDVMVPHHHLKKGGSVEQALQPGQKHGKFSVIGTKRIGTQVHAMVHHHETGENHQVDFEGAKYEGNHPSKWNQLSTNSHKEDMSAGIKGVHHKLLLNAAVKGSKTIHGVTLDRKKNIKTEGEHPAKTFSTQYGVRDAYRHTGGIHSSGAKILEKVGPRHKPTYMSDPQKIAHSTFGHKKAEIDSFHGVVRSMKKHFSPKQISRTITNYHDKNTLKRINPNSKQTKTSVAILRKHFPEHYKQ